MDHIVLTFADYVPLDLVQRPGIDKIWEIFATDGPGRGCRPAAMVDVVSLVIDPTGVTATFPNNVEIFIPVTMYKACAGHPMPTN